MNIAEEIKNLQEHLNNIEDKIELDNTNLLDLKNKKKEFDNISIELKELNDRLIEINNNINVFTSKNKKKLNNEKEIYNTEKNRINSKKEYLYQYYNSEITKLTSSILETQLQLIKIKIEHKNLLQEQKDLKENKLYIRNKYLTKIKEKNAKIKDNKKKVEEINQLKTEREEVINLINNYQNAKYLINKEYYDYKKEVEHIEETIKLLKTSSGLEKNTKLKLLLEMKNDLDNDIRKEPNKRYEELERKHLLNKKRVKIFDKMISNYNTKNIIININNEKMPNNYTNNKKRLLELETKKNTIKNKMKEYNNTLLILEYKQTETSIAEELKDEINRCEIRLSKINERINNENITYKNKFTMEIKKLENRKKQLQNKLSLLRNLNFNEIKEKMPIVEKNNELLSSIKGRIRFLKSNN